MKKIIALLFAVLLSLTAFTGTALAAPEFDGKVEPFAVLLMDADSGAVLYAKNADERVEPASTTKIMTLIIALEQADLDSVVTISAKAAGQRGSLLKVSAGEKIVMRDLLYGMMLASGNDAAMAVAEAVGGSEEGFSELMNKKAQELGMAHTHFVAPHGMHVENHYTTASDMAILTRYAMQNPDFAHIVAQASYTMPANNKKSAPWEVKNTNKLLHSDDQYYYKYATGVKTGSTPAAGDCLVSSATKDGMNLICLVFGDKFNGYRRWPLSAELFEFGFKNFRTLNIQAVMDAAGPVSVPVQGAAEDAPQTVQLSIKNAAGEYQTFDKDTADKIESGSLTSRITLSGGDALTAPVTAGSEVGTIDYLDDAGNLIYRGVLVAQESVEAASEPVPETSPAPSGTRSPVTRAPEGAGSGIGTLGWILIAVGGVLLILLILFSALLIARKRRYARRRARRRRPSQHSSQRGR